LRSFVSLIVAAALAWCGASSFAIEGVAAQPAQEDAAYHDLVRGALAAFDAKNWSEARRMFSTAHALQPSARTLRGLGMVAFEMGEYVEARQLLREALDDPRRPLEAELRADTEALLGRTRALLARVRLNIEPAGAELTLDGKPLARPTPRELWMKAGRHALEARAPGHRSRLFPITAAAGDDQLVEVRLEPATVAVRERPQLVSEEPHASSVEASLAPAPSDDRDEDSGAITEQWWFWAGAGALAIGAGVTVAVLAAGGEEPQRLTRGTDGVVITTLSLP
jgi:tetratricopeptide (TPR) repeat protein